MTTVYTGRVHNCWKVLIDSLQGTDLYMGSIHVNGRFKADEPGEITSPDLYPTIDGAVSWVRLELIKRGVPAKQVQIVVDDSHHPENNRRIP